MKFKREENTIYINDIREIAETILSMLKKGNNIIVGNYIVKFNNFDCMAIVTKSDKDYNVEIKYITGNLQSDVNIKINKN